MLSEKKGLERLSELKNGYRQRIADGYEHKAKSCLTCETQGACCLDAHFVNVHITRLEAVSMRRAIDGLPPDRRNQIYERSAETVEKYGLSTSGDTFEQKFACPLFEKGTGCLVHASGKPLPCIQHACYENESDLPPDELLA